MAAAGHNDINLLPHDRKRFNRKETPKSVIKPDYTAPKAGNKDKKSIFGRIFSIFKRKHKHSDKTDAKIIKPVMHDLPQGKPLPSAMFSKASNRLPEKPPKKEISKEKSNGVQASNIMSMHSPDFIKKQASQIPAPAPIQAPAPAPEKQENKQKPKHEPLKDTAASKVAKSEAKNNATKAPVHRQSSFDVNLLSEEYSRSFQKINPIATFLTWVGAAFAVIILIYAGIYAYSAKARVKADKANTISQALEQTITTYNSIEQQDSELRRKIDIVESLLGSHISWNQFLGKLEQETIPEVTYFSFAASTQGSIAVSAVSQDYTSLARQITVFQETEWIEDLQITSATLLEDTATLPGGVGFDMQIFINKRVLYSIE